MMSEIEYVDSTTGEIVHFSLSGHNSVDHVVIIADFDTNDASKSSASFAIPSIVAKQLGQTLIQMVERYEQNR